MPELKFVEGGISVDFRGQISHVNDLNMSEIERFYIIHQKDSSIIRAWHAHQHEKKWFYVVKGSFTATFVKVDNWENPSPALQAEIFQLNAQQSKVLLVPEGYANGFKANEPDSILLVFSNKILSEAVKDSWRYDKEMWVDWSQYVF
ncbi:dTDP-4-dehydrorhamnose 3,5-epimerase family protein [uncultured Odoribacter sp.]|uniref:dTDP-4-dehydrorhamnose 3,5-epimerase family protein n=1 Tax=uncultured Odoribacter sp. TaxID=876416 RepID=UPI0026291756|nr:dTDP-4-dehydrorhamnose 3,5-epimerase family protein [uncultured Odoribacter sp.]